MFICEALTQQWLQYIRLSRGRCPATRLHATINVQCIYLLKSTFNNNSYTVSPSTLFAWLKKSMKNDLQNIRSRSVVHGATHKYIGPTGVPARKVVNHYKDKEVDCVPKQHIMGPSKQDAGWVLLICNLSNRWKQVSFTLRPLYPRGSVIPDLHCT
jgi:hypothetical protein